MLLWRETTSSPDVEKGGELEIEMQTSALLCDGGEEVCFRQSQRGLHDGCVYLTKGQLLRTLAALEERGGEAA